MLFAGCEKAQEEKISINTKDAIKLDLFQSQEEWSEEDWGEPVPNTEKLVLQGQFEEPYRGYCSRRELLVKQWRSVEEQASEIEDLIARYKWIKVYDSLR